MEDIKVVAFDCDGVMFDTTIANQAYYNQILDHFSRTPLTAEQFEYAQSHTVEDSIAYLFGDEVDLLRQVNAFRKEISYFPFIQRMVIEPYLKTLLDHLRDHYKTAVATNRTDTMDSVITEHGLQGYFDLVLCASDVEHPKPYPDLLEKIGDHFKCAPHQIVYIGDSQLDEMAARAAGVIFLAYGNPALEADCHLSSLKDIEPLLP